jgi:hypothetical protein
VAFAPEGLGLRLAEKDLDAPAAPALISND